jgi:hypothetical protein
MTNVTVHESRQTISYNHQEYSVAILIYKMKDSFLVWAGDQDPEAAGPMNNMIVGMLSMQVSWHNILS